MACGREILAHNKDYLAAVYDKHTTVYCLFILQQGNIST